MYREATHVRTFKGLVFVTSILVTSLFWRILPDTFRINENSDYIGFYEPVGRNILEGRGFTCVDGTPAIAYPPGYPLLLAGIFGFSHLVNVSEETILSIFILLSVGLTSVFVFMLARSLWGSLPGLISSAVWITYPFALWLTKQPNSEIPFMVIFYGTFCLLWYVLLRKSYAWPIYFLVGLLTGVAMLIRPIAIGIGFVMGAILWLAGHGMTMRFRLLLIMMILLGNLVAIFPWEAWVYSKTGRVVLLSTIGASGMYDGLTFALNLEGYRQGVAFPQDVQALMQNIHVRVGEMQSFGGVLSAMIEELQMRPLAVVKLLAIKTVRSWYATDSQRFETPIMLIQMAYLVVMIWSSKVAWKRGGIAKQLAISVWLMTLYFWGMTILGSSLFRYMVPAMGLLFLLLPALFQSGERESRVIEEPNNI